MIIMKGEIFDDKPHVQDMEPGTYAWCACGQSKKNPFCDGSHKSTEFFPTVVVVKEKKRLAWCNCKQTSNPPFCDGTHKSVKKS